MDNNSSSWTSTTAYEPLIEAFIFTIPETPAITTTPPSAVVAAAKPITPTTAVMTTISQHAPSSPSLHPLEQLPVFDTYAQNSLSPSFPMSPLQANINSSSSISTTCPPPPSTSLQITTENATLPPVNISNSTTTSLDTSGTPASNTPFTTSNINSSTLYTNNNTNTVSNTVINSYTEPKPTTSTTANNNSSSDSSTVSRHASSPSSSTTASDESTKNVSPSVRKISTMTSGGKTLGFFGSLSSNSSRYKISNKRTTALGDSSCPPSPALPSSYSNTTTPTTSHFAPPTLPPSHAPDSFASSQPEEVTTPTLQYLQLPVSSNINSPSGKLSMDQPDSPRPSQRFYQQQLQHELQQESPESSKDKADKKRSKDKDRHHSHFGQRLSKAIGLSSSSFKNQQQQRLRQTSVDSLSTIDAVPHPIMGTTTTSDESPRHQLQQAQRQSGKTTPEKEKEKEKEKKGGIMNQFLHRPRILSPSDSAKPKGSTQYSAGGATRVAGSMAALSGSQVNDFNTPNASFAQSATNSDISLDSESHRQEGTAGSGFAAAGEDNDMATLRKFQSHHRQDRGSSSSSKSLVDTLTARDFRRRPSLIVDLMPLPSSQQRQHRQQHQHLPPSIADMVESAQELHPHYQPEDMERLSLYNHLGLQEIHYNTSTGEEPSEQMIRQLYGSASAPRKSHSSTLLLPRQNGPNSSSNNMGVLEPHGRRRSSPGANLSGLNTSIPSNNSPLGAMAASPVTPSKPTSSRLGKLGRFKFPSLSMSSIHRHKQSSLNGSTSSIHSTSDDQHHAMLLADFNNKRRSSLSIPFKSSMFDSAVTAVPPPSPASHIHVSDSVSTFASVNTVGMTSMGPSTVGSSSNHSSISSSYNVLDTTAAAGGSMGDSKKPRQSLAAFLEEQAHHPHHSSTNGMSGLPSTASVVSPAQQQQHQQLQTLRPVLVNQDIAAGAPLQQQHQHQHQQHGHQRQKSRSLGKSFAGSEQFSASTASVTAASSGSIASGSSGNSSQHHHGMTLGFRSGLLRRNSRRTVSASHISSKSIFASDPATTSHQEAASLAYRDLMESQVRAGPGGGSSTSGAEVKSTIRQFKSDRDIISTALLHDLAADTQDTHGDKHGEDGGDGAGDSGADGIPSVESTISVVGQYLFGDELGNLSFGDRNSTLVKVDSAVDTTEAVLFEAESGLKTMPANTVAEDVLVVAQVTIPTTPTSPPANATMATMDSDKALLSNLLSGKKKSDTFLPSAKDSTLSTHSLPTLATSPQVASTSPTHLYTTDSKPAPGSVIIPRDRKLILGSKILPNSKQHETPTTPTPPTFIPRSPAAVAASRKFPGSLGYSSSSPSSYLTHPPVSGPQTPVPGTTTTTSKSKFSILGTSSTPNSGFSYLQSRPSLSLTMSSSAAPSKNQGVGPSSISTSSPYMPHHSSSTPLPGKSSSGFGSSGSPTPPLEPRSAVVDYRPAIHYKRQRSMSLQDADLLTADQFIALMPDDAPTKRRFSSEETFPDNNSWATSVKAKHVPLPDPPTTLKSLHSTLKTKCDLVLKHLAAVSAPVPSTLPTTLQQQQQQRQDQTQQQASTAPRHMASGMTSASFVPTAAYSSSNLTLSTLSHSGSDSFSSSTTELARTFAQDKEASLAASPSEQILIRIQGTEGEQTSLIFKDEGVGSRRVSVDDTYSKRRGSGHSFVTSATLGSVRPKKSSLVAVGASSESGGEGRAAGATSTDRPSEPCEENSVSIDLDQIDVVETVGMLFDEMDQIITRMAEMLAKYISTDQFSNLLKESDEICFQAQEVCRVELDRRCSQRHQQFRQQQQHQHQQVPERNVEMMDVEVVYECKTMVDTQVPSAHCQYQSQPQKPEFNKESKKFEEPNDYRYEQPTPLSAQQDSSHQPPSTVATTTDTVLALAVGPETIGDVDDRQVKKKDSKERIRHRRNRNHYKHQYRYQPQGLKPGESDVNGEMSSEEHQGAVYDYIRTVLATAEVAMGEYMRTYNRMLVVPTSGYKIEGCNDLKKIERSLRPEHPHMPPLSITTPKIGSSQPSLMSRVSAVQNAAADATTPSEVSTSQTSAVISSADYNPSNPSGSSAYVSPITTADANQTLSSTTMNTFSPSPNATPGGEAMVRVKSLPESKDEWAALQKRKEMGGSPGVAGAISMGTPAAVGISVSTPGAGVGGIGGIGATGAAAGLATGTGIAMMGEYSKEHMGHEAYYYRNWFLGKEHRTFVGQVEGLGTVIISIIKDMVVPTETRPQIPSRSSTGPSSLSQQSSFVAPTGTGAAGSGSNAHSVTHVRPELVHSAQSFYPGRGGGYHGHGVGGSGMMASPRTSSEATRVILSASTAVTSGPGSHDSHGSGLSGIGGPHSGPGSATVSMVPSHLVPSTYATSGSYSPSSLQTNFHSGSNNNTNAPPRWQYRCILRQKDVDSLRITLPEPEPSPLNNLTRRAGKPQWKTILQSIHPAITQQVASKLKKVQNNQHFEKELAKFDETMLRFNYKFGVLLVHSGQTKEEDWFSNQMSSSPRFQEFLESGALGQKVALKGFERFSAGLDTRNESAEYSYYDTWGEGFEIMYHVSTLLPYNTVDRQQIQRKRHIGNDIVCIIFVDGDQPFVPNAIKSQFLHIFVIIRLVTLPDGAKAYSATIACDEQVPEFGPPLPDPPIFRTPAELRAFLLCKMINGENAAYKAPRLIKPHQRARSGMLENLVAKANTLAKVKDIDKKLSKQQKVPPVSTSTLTAAVTPTTPSILSGGSSSHHTLPSMSSSASLTPSHPSTGGAPYNQVQSKCHACHYSHYHQNPYQYGCHHCPYEKDGPSCCSVATLASTSAASLGEEHTHPHHQSTNLINGRKGPIPAAIRTNSARNSLVVLGSETAATLFKSRRRNSNADSTKLEAQFPAGNMSAKEKEMAGNGGHSQQQQQQQQAPGQFPEGHGYIENLLSPTVPNMMALPSPGLGPTSLSVADIGTLLQQGDTDHCSGSCCQRSCCCYTSCCGYSCCDESDHAIETFQARPQLDKPTSAMKSGISHSLLQQHNLQSALKQSSKSAAASPTESQFAMNRAGNSSQANYHSNYHTVTLMNGLDVAMVNTEWKDSNTLGMSLTANNKGRSKSEVDLLVTPIHETHNSSPNRHSTGLILGSGMNGLHHHHHSHAEIVATTPHPHHHHYYNNRGHQHSLLAAGGAISIRSSTTTTATTGSVIHQAATVPAHSSMKGRAHNFLTTLVRRRASSNDTSGLGPTAHQMSAPKHSHLSVTASSSPLGTWINTAGGHHHHSHRTHAYQNLQHHQQHQQQCHHSHCCQGHRYQHHSPLQRHSLTSLSTHVTSTTPALAPAPMAQESPAAIPIIGRPLKFKEGFNKGKIPIHINTAAAAAMGSSHPNQYYQQSLHHNCNQNVPPSASTVSSASSSPFFHSSLPSASTLRTADSAALRSGSWGPAAGAAAAAVANSGSGAGLYSSSSTNTMLATPSSSFSTGFTPHLLRSFVSREAIHRSTFSPPQNQWDQKQELGRSTSECSEDLTPNPVLTVAGGPDSGGATQSKAEEKSSSDSAQVPDMVDGQQDVLQFTESPLPYTPQGQTPPALESKVMEPRSSIDSLGGQPGSNTTTTTATAMPTVFPPGIGNLHKTSMDYMSFKPATSSMSSSSARNSLLEQQRYDPGLSSAAARARQQSGDVRRGRRADADPDDDDVEDRRNSSEDLARFLSMGPLSLRESHSVMALDCHADHHCHQNRHHTYQHHQHLHHHHGHHSSHSGYHNHQQQQHHHHHYHHVRQQQQQHCPRDERRPSSGSLPVRNESSSIFYHTGMATTVAHHPLSPKPSISFGRTEVRPSLSRTSTSSSMKQVKRAVSVESFLGQESVLSRVPSLRSKGFGLEAALLSTMTVPPGLTESYTLACTNLPPAPVCYGSGSIAHKITGADTACVMMPSDQDKHAVPETDSLVTDDAINNTAPIIEPTPDLADPAMATGAVSVAPGIARTRQDSTFVLKDNENQHSCSHEVENLDIRPIDA